MVKRHITTPRKNSDTKKLIPEHTDSNEKDLISRTVKRTMSLPHPYICTTSTFKADSDNFLRILHSRLVFGLFRD